ncbi:PAAR domain-containing protein [Psychrobacter aquimaris]|uniref:PAAR domain-containing protein n=1 Tax=Psychrobacter aquimaris TaxID=292733 RepID=UPI003FCF5A9E
MAAYITVGAKTSHGGTVISGSPHTTHNGIPVARKGDKVICKKCKKVTTILSGDASFIVDGAPIARGGDVTSCGAKLIAIQQSFAESDFDVGSIAQAAPLVFPKSDLQNNLFKEKDKGAYLTLSKIYLKDNTYVPMGIPKFNDSIANGLKHSKIYIEVKIHSGTFKNLKLNILGTGSGSSGGSALLAEKIGIFSAGDMVAFEWNGFVKDKYDSSMLVHGEQEFKVTGQSKSGFSADHSKTVKFGYKQEQWADIKINKQNKRIDVSLRINIADAIEFRGIPPSKVAVEEIKASRLLNRMLVKPNMTDNDLLKLASAGVKKYWSRNHSTHSHIKPHVTIQKQVYQVYTEAILSNKRATNQTKVTYNTNGKFGRSNNFPKFQEVVYNTGCLKRSDGRWVTRNADYSNNKFEETFAHELGHTFVSAYRGDYQSLIHEGSSTVLQAPNDTYQYPTKGELDLMKYARGEPKDFFERVVANETDVKGLLWASRLELN